MYGSEYDANGNMVSERNRLTGETKKFYWDAENRMTKYEHQASDVSPIDITAEYKYDIFSRRLQKNVNGTITNFFWENDTMTYELDEQYQPIRKYITGLGMDDYEGHLEYSEVTEWSSHIFNPQYNPPWYTYMKDQVGTVYKVYDHRNHSIADSRAYDSFGNFVNQTGTTKTPLGFQGKYYDAESGLNYFYHRYYNPTIGRFTSEDPIGVNGGLNLFKFNGNNPVNSIDPFGEITCTYSIVGKTLNCVTDCGEEITCEAKSGNDCLNSQCQRNVGPIPIGQYIIIPANPCRTRAILIPMPETDTCGRGGFQIHGWGNTTGCIAIRWNDCRDRIMNAIRNENGGVLDVTL